MKITIKNKGALLLNRVLNSVPYAVIFFIVTFVVTAVVMPIVLMKEMSEIAGQVSLVSFAVALIFIAIKVFDAYLYSKETFLKVDDKNVECGFSGFKKGRISFLNSQVQSMNVRQNLADRILGLSRVEITQISGKLTVYGFDFKEASDFVSKFNSKYKPSKQI